MAHKIERNISLGNILTLSTIIVSVIFFLITWNKEIDTKRSAQANQIRVAAATILVKLDRWKTVSFSLSEQIKPDFVDTKEMLKKNFDVIEARDHLWKALYKTRVALLRRASEDQVEMAYLELYAYHPEVRELFVPTLAKAKNEEAHMFKTLASKTQYIVLSWKGRKDEYRTALLWTDLTKASDSKLREYQASIDSIFAPLFEMLNTLITLPDDIILQRPNLVELAKKS
jgi:hypothetical protein